jgi:Lipase maturation factor
MEDAIEGLRPRFPFWESPHGYWLTRFVILRLLGVVYLAAFVCAARQYVPLVGLHGLLPAAPFLERVKDSLGTPEAYFKLPTLFWFDASDGFFRVVSWVGVLLSLLLAAGFANAILLFLLWGLYLSLVQTGQLFYGYGWESLLLETGFLTIFLAPPLDPRPFAASAPPPRTVIWLYRWLVFRIMFGAGLIKLRGDPCWRDLTCLVYHYETQPLPNPVSWLMNQLPLFVQKGSVLFNHYAELVAPFFLAGPRRIRLVGGMSVIVFQLLLIVSGNLSWLNWLTIVSAVAALDDGFLRRAFPAAVRARVLALGAAPSMTRLRRGVVYGLAAVVGALSINPTVNLFSHRQLMNSSFDPLYLVNTYGAFGSIEKVRHEIIVEGTTDEAIDERTAWLPYEFNCKPGDVDRRPCIVAPYQYRLDWQMWFAAMSTYRQNPWFIHFAYKLLEGDERTLGLIANNPFPGAPPRYLRAELYRYEMTHFGDGPAFWRRTRVGGYLPPVRVDDPSLLDYLDRHGWLTP